MKNNEFLLSIVAFSIIFQCITMRTVDMFEYQLPFLAGLVSADSMSGNITLILYSIIPLPFLLMLFSGDMKNLTEGYGKLLIIRNYSKRRLVLEMMIRTIVKVIIFVVFMGCVFTLFKDEEWSGLHIVSQGKALVMYGLTLTAIILIQYILELYLETQYANIAVIIGIVVSLFISGAELEKYWFTNFVLFPNLAFAQKNGIISNEATEGIIGYTCIWIIFINFILGGIILRKFTKKDVM